MSDQEHNGSLQPITVDTAKQKFLIELTKVNYLAQTLQNRADALVMNEDNLEEIGKFLADSKAAKKVIETTHAVVKKPYWDSGKNVDQAKNDLIKVFDAIDAPVNQKFQQMSDAIAKRKREAAEKAELERNIKQAVEANILDFSTKIAACTTRQQLTDVERIINLQKSPSGAAKYGDWHEFAISRYDQVLLPILKDQKKKIDEKEKLEAELAKTDDPAKHDELKGKLEEKESEILQNQVKIQEQALNQQQLPSEYAEEVFPEVKQAGSNIICEIVDEKKAFQKQRHLLNIELKLVDAKKLASTLRTSGAFGDKDELIVDGIKFTLERRYK